MKATFIDFEDSFSFNLVQQLVEEGFDVRVIPWKDFEQNPEEGLLVFGPGPGHPDDYQKIYPLLKDWLKEGKPFFGVCLGHQIFWRIHDEEVVRSKDPLHGQRVRLELSQMWRGWLSIEDEVFVQRYNSLTVTGQALVRNPFFDNFIQNDEILITKGERFITYQFHPESIGTSYRKSFIKVLYSIL